MTQHLLVFLTIIAIIALLTKTPRDSYKGGGNKARGGETTGEKTEERGASVKEEHEPGCVVN